jgi:RNA polymerase sigma-70 factor (ECF subfamily)
VTPPREERDRWRREYGAYLRGLARKLCRSQLDPEDLVKDVLERPLRAAIPAGADERAWLARAMHELFIDRLCRRQSQDGELAETLEYVRAPHEERPWWQGLTADGVRAQVARLPDEERAAFELLALGGASYRDIAARLGIAKDSVAERILRARRRLRTQLAEERGRG